MQQNMRRKYDVILNRTRQIRESYTGSQTPKGIMYPESGEIITILEEELLGNDGELCRSRSDIYVAIDIIKKLQQSDLPNTTRALCARAGALLVILMLRKIKRQGDKKIGDGIEAIHMTAIKILEELEDYGRMVGYYDNIYMVSEEINCGDRLINLKRWRNIVDQVYNQGVASRNEIYYKNMLLIVWIACKDGRGDYLQELKQSVERIWGGEMSNTLKSREESHYQELIDKITQCITAQN